MQNEIELTFPHSLTNSCFAVFNSIEAMIIEDMNNKCILSFTEPNYSFLAKNPNLKQISFLSIDKCTFFDNSTHKKCDCALFDDHTFCFIELKNTNKSQKKKSRKKAYKQLEDTIILFQPVFHTKAYNIEAIVAFKYPSVPAISAFNQSMIKYFFDMYNAALLEGNQKKFI